MLTNSLWQKWCCASFTVPDIKDLQPPFPTSMLALETWSPSRHGEALCRWNDSQHLPAMWGCHLQSVSFRTNRTDATWERAELFPMSSYPNYHCCFELPHFGLACSAAVDSWDNERKQRLVKASTGNLYLYDEIIALQDKNTCETIKLGASDLGCTAREGFPSDAWADWKKLTGWRWSKKELWQGLMVCRSTRYLKRKRKSAWIRRYGVQGVNQRAAVKMGSIQVLEWAVPMSGSLCSHRMRL